MIASDFFTMVNFCWKHILQNIGKSDGISTNMKCDEKNQRCSWLIAFYSHFSKKLQALNIILNAIGFFTNAHDWQLSFSKIDKIGNVGIRGFTTWKKSSDKMLPPVGIEPEPLITSDSKSNTILSTVTWHVLHRRSLNFCSCTTWCLDLDDLRRINRAWLYKEPKVSVLQANVKLV